MTPNNPKDIRQRKSEEVWIPREKSTVAIDHSTIQTRMQWLIPNPRYVSEAQPVDDEKQSYGMVQLADSREQIDNCPHYISKRASHLLCPRSVSPKALEASWLQDHQRPNSKFQTINGTILCDEDNHRIPRRRYRHAFQKRTIANTA